MQIASKEVKGFQASIGWVDRFLRRYDRLRTLIRYAKDGDFDLVRRASVAVKHDLEHS